MRRRTFNQIVAGSLVLPTVDLSKPPSPEIYGILEYGIGYLHPNIELIITYEDERREVFDSLRVLPAHYKWETCHSIQVLYTTVWLINPNWSGTVDTTLRMERKGRQLVTKGWTVKTGWLPRLWRFKYEKKDFRSAFIGNYGASRIA
ncbi:MAG: hypothetical protein ACXABY_04220 [Candidatus Thorarchaeota archaeon]|jgi:hypothetical protein